MKRLTLSLLLLCIPLLGIAESQEVVEVEISGMFCESCAHTIEENLSKLHGVAEVDVSFKEKKGHLIMDHDQRANFEDIRKNIRDKGYTPGEIKVTAQE